MFFFKKDKNVVKTSYATVLDSLFKFITKIGRGKVRNGGGGGWRIEGSRKGKMKYKEVLVMAMALGCPKGE